MRIDRIGLIAATALFCSACIAPNNPVIEASGGGASGEGGGTPDIVRCGVLDDVQDGKDYVARSAQTLADGRVHPDIFYIGWSQLDSRNDLRFPTNGYAGEGFEDKLFVSRRRDDGGTDTWQLLPMLDETCEDEEQIRIHSFDISPDGESLYVSMRREGDTHLGIYEFDFHSYGFRKITHQDDIHFIYPTYVGDHEQTGHRTLFVARTVLGSDIPLNYGGPTDGVLLDEYDRADTPLIHSLDVETGDVARIGLNNSHQLDPLSIARQDGTRLVVFTQWEHQQTTNRFSLWKLQVDGSDNFTFFGQESATDLSGANIFQPREIKSGPYAGYILMAQGRSGFVADGSIAMTERVNLDLRSDRVFLEQYDSPNQTNIARNPEHYNDQSMVYAYRNNVNEAYGIHLKDYPASLSGNTTLGTQSLIKMHPDFHMVQPRSYYPPERAVTAPGEGTIGESRASFTNAALNGAAGFLVQDLTESDNGVQHQLDGIDPNDLRMQFFIPSQTFGASQAVGKLGWGSSPELSVPASDFLAPESDGSFGAVLKSGLYAWKLNKRFDHNGSDIWIPVRAERQEVSFVPNRVNACNQCHQERSQANIDLYDNRTTIASQKMESNDLSNVANITGYDAYFSVPDYHTQIQPMFAGCAVAGCHDARDKLDLSNETGARSQTSTWLALVRGAHKLASSEDVVPYVYNSINPTGFDDQYHPAPFLWSLLLGDDLSVPSAPGFPDDSSRNLTRAGDYGATFDQRITDAVAAINTQYDHTQHWTPAQVQAFITYSTTQTMVGLSDRVQFTTDGSGYTSSAAGQKAYQAMVRRCFDCHNNHNADGVDATGFGKPANKRFRGSTDLKSTYLRLVVDSHLANKADTAYSPYLWQSDLDTSMSKTLSSARDRINFDSPTESQLLVYARCDNLHANVAHSNCLNETGADYLALKAWVEGGTATNLPPVVDSNPGPITFAEYDDPALVGPVTWSDPDSGDISQVKINPSSSSSHAFNDSMLSLAYQSLTSANVEAYAILGDRGSRQFEFTATDGLPSATVQTVPVTVTSDYVVPKPKSDLPQFSAFYTVRQTGELRRIDDTGTDVSVGFIAGYSTGFTTVYRRADKGWLYFVNQSEQRVYVVNETNAAVEFTVDLNHAPNKETSNHKQTVYLIWWRPAEYDGFGNLTRAGELQGLLESKQGNNNGDFYVGLGDGEAANTVVVPEWRNRISQANNAVSVYVWRRATFMTQIVGNGIDNLNALNLVTGKAKGLSDFSFEAKTYQGTVYAARDYFNVRAVLLSEDGAFYGFNQDLSAAPELFSFDPLEKVQVPVPLPTWLSDLLGNPQQYATPFVVVPAQTP